MANAKEPIAFISHGNIGRGRVERSDPETGIPMEGSIPVLGELIMYDKDGNRVSTPTRCHRSDPPAMRAKYAPRLLADNLTAGYLEEGKCPHMPREQLGGKASVPAPDGFKLCDGQGPLDPKTFIGGCAHLKKIVGVRRSNAKRDAAGRDSESGRAALLLAAQAMTKATTTMAAVETAIAARPVVPSIPGVTA